MHAKTADSLRWRKKAYTPPLQALLLWQSLSLFWIVGILASRWLIPCILIAIILPIIDARLRAPLPLCTAALLFAIGFAVAHAQLKPRPPTPPWLSTQEHTTRTWQGTVTKVQSLPDKRLRIFLDNIIGHTQEGEHPLNGTAIWTWDFSKIPPDAIPPTRPIQGHTVHFQSKLYTSESFRNFGISSYGFYWQSKGVFWRFWSRAHPHSQNNPVRITGITETSAKIRERIRQRFEKAVFHAHTKLSANERQARAFLPALIFGDKFFLDTHTMTLMAEASLVHSLALSGQHLALAYLVAACIVYIIHLFFPFLYLSLPKRHLVACTSLCFALLYVWIGDAPPSLLRASTMLAIAVFLYCSASPNDTLADIVIVTVVLLSVYNPMIVFDIGFQLSVLCVGSIVLILPVLRRIPTLPASAKDIAPISYTILKAMRSALQIFLISLAIQIIMMPVFLLYFQPNGEWLIANVFWLPVLSLWVLPLSALSCAMASLLPNAPFLPLLIHISALPCEYLLLLLQYLEPFFSNAALLRPHWTVLPASASLFIALALLIGRKKSPIHPTPPSIHRLFIISAILFCIAPLLRFAENWCVKIEMLDVGQGQGIYLQLPGGQRFLVDGGGGFSPRFDVGKALVVPRLVANAPPHMHALINTHPDADHSRGLLGIMESMDISNLYTNGQIWSQEDLKRYNNIKYAPPMHALHAGMHIPVATPPFMPRYTLEVLHPPQHMASATQSTNNASLVIRLVQHTDKHTKGLVLLCGDIQKKGTHTLLNSQQNISADILIIPHHGGASSLVPSLYDAVKAHTALISAGKNNSYGFPHTSVKNALQERHIHTLTTADHGAIRIRLWPFPSVTHH